MIQEVGYLQKNKPTLTLFLQKIRAVSIGEEGISTTSLVKYIHTLFCTKKMRGREKANEGIEMKGEREERKCVYL